MARSYTERRGEGSSGRDLALALALASALPCAVLLWPGAVPQEIVVLSLMAWAGIFVAALWSAWVQDRRRRKGQGETAAAQRLHPRG
jgi:hypothetical protein